MCGTLSISRGKQLDYLHLKDFLKHKCELYLNTTIRQDHCCFTAPRIIDFPLRHDDGQLSLEIILALINVVKNEAHLVPELHYK